MANRSNLLDKLHVQLKTLSQTKKTPNINLWFPHLRARTYTHTCTYVHIYKHAHTHTHVPTHTREERNSHHGLTINVYIKTSNYGSSKILRVTEEKQIKGISPCIEQKHYFLSSILKIQQRSSDMLATIITLAHLLNPRIVRNQ